MTLTILSTFGNLSPVGLTSGEIEGIGAILLYLLAFGVIVFLAKVILDSFFWGILGLDLFGGHVEEAQRLRQEKERRRQQREYDRQLAAQRYQEEQERQRAEAERRRSEADLHSDREGARQHLEQFCRTHETLLADVFPPALLHAFLRSQMPDSIGATDLWGIAQKKITELLPVIQQGREQLRKEEERRAARELRLKNLNAEIASNREKIERLKKSGLDADTVEDETQGLLVKIRHLEEQQELLKTLNDDQ